MFLSVQSTRRPSDAPAPNREKISVAGIPFLPHELFVLKEGESPEIAFHPVRADWLFLLEPLNSIDRGNPDWGGGDEALNFFVGDSIGTLSLTYESGRIDSVPLICGYNVWWRVPYQQSPAPFSNDESARTVLRRALRVIHGAEGHQADAPPYLMAIRLRNEALLGVTLHDSDKKAGHFKPSGLTLAGVQSPLPRKDEHLAEFSGDLDPALAARLETHAIESADAYPSAARQAVADLARFLYTFEEDVRLEGIRETPPAMTSENFSGPAVRFRGPPEAEILTHVYYENAHEVTTRIGADGLVHESREKAIRYADFGGFTPDLGAYYNLAYTRNRALTVLAEMGFVELADRAVDFFDRWLMYFPESFPEVQIDGKPVPGHTPVIANTPHFYFDVLKDHGWPTRYTTRDFGNPETDGHGMLMLARWRVWVQLGRPAEWVERRWKALREAAEFVRWALDNPGFSFSENGLLYAESEGGMQQLSLYSNMPVYFGLLAYAEMADRIGREEEAHGWRELAAGLAEAMEGYFPQETEKFGEVWNPELVGGFKYHSGVLAPLLFSMDWWGYDAAARLREHNPAWLARTERSYKMILNNMRPEWCAPSGLGYGQNYFAQSALLLDYMGEATPIIEWLARFCYAPRQPDPYRVPEGATISGAGDVWRRWGDLGNLYQMVDTVYTIQVLLGIDDLDATHLRLMPRLPAGWTGMEVSDWPVRADSLEQKGHLLRLRYNLERPSKNILKMAVETDFIAIKMSLRLGPFPVEGTDPEIRLNGAPVTARVIASGDARWTWVNLQGACHYEIIAELSPEGN